MPIQGSSHAIPWASIRTYHPAPPTLTGEPLQKAAARNASLHCYIVTDSDSAQSLLLTILRTLCNDLRDPSDRLARRAMAVVNDDESGWIPRVIFHVSGDFQNVHSNSVMSVLLTKPPTPSYPSGEKDIAGEHSWLHIYDGVHLAQSFTTVLKSYVRQGALRRLEVDGEGNGGVLGMVEACAMVGVKCWVEGGEADEKGRWEIVEKMVGRLEGLLWGIWLEAMDS